MKELLLYLLLIVPGSARYGSNYCVLFYSVTDLTRKCDGFDVYIERNYTNGCEYDDCPSLGINPASVGDSYRGDGICWNYPQWRGEVNSANVDLTINAPNRWIPECWWFGPDGKLNHDGIDVTNSVDCNAEFTDEIERLMCWCKQPVWDSGSISDFDDVTMLSACCACGGGLSYDPEIGPPTDAPTIPPSPIPTQPPTPIMVPEGTTVHRFELDFDEAMYDQDTHQSEYFKKLVQHSIAQELGLLLSDVSIESVEESTGVLIRFYILNGVEDPITKQAQITARIYEDLSSSGNSLLPVYDGFSTASISEGDDTQTTSESNTSRSITVGVASGLILSFLGLTVYSYYKKRRDNVNSHFVFRSPNV